MGGIDCDLVQKKTLLLQLMADAIDFVGGRELHWVLLHCLKYEMRLVSFRDIRALNLLEADGSPELSSSEVLGAPSSIAMSGTVFTRSFRKSKRDSDMMHCFR